MKFSRSLIFISLICVALLSSAYDSQHALTNEVMEIESSLKQVEGRLTTATRFSFNDGDIQSVLKKMHKMTLDLQGFSAKGPSDVITDASSRYLTALAEIHALYARQAHLPGGAASGFDFATLDSYNLKLHSDAAHPLVIQKPFNARHADGDFVEFFITAEENQMAEFLALSSPKDEFTYEKLIQLVAVREAYVNFWGLQRMSYSELPLQSVNSCAPDLLSFRLNGPGGHNDPKSSAAYQQLIALDRYNGLTEKLSGAYNLTQDFTLATSADYYFVLTRLFSATPEFKSYIQGLPPAQVSSWLNTAAASISKNESDDWLSDPENSRKILGASTLIGDDQSSWQISTRMANAVAQRHLESASAQIEKIATGNLKISDSPELESRIRAALQSYEAPAALSLAPKLLPSVKDLDDQVDSRKQISDRILAKIAEIQPVAENLMAAVHDDLLIKQSLAPLAETQGDADASLETADRKIYIRGDYQYFVADSAVFQTHLTNQIRNEPALWNALNADQSAMTFLNRFFLDLDRNMSQEIQQLGPQATRDQLGQELLRFAQTGATATLGQAASDPNGQALLQKAFNTIQLFSAKTPMDLAPTNDSQKELLASAIAQGYELSPILGVKWKRSGFFTQSKTLLYYLYDQGMQDASSLTYEAIQNAVVADRGKLEDFCQANLHDPKHDTRFRNMFLTASHLRQIIGHSDSKAQMVRMKGFDDDLVKQTQTTQEALLNRYLNPIITVLFVATLVALALMAAPVSAFAAIPMLLAILNMYVIAPLSVVSLYMQTSVDFYEKPAQLKYQDAVASSQISSDPFDDWEEMKKEGLLSDTTDRVSVDKNSAALTKTQLISIAELPMDIWYGQSIVKGVRSSVGITGMNMMKKLFGGDIPAFAATVKPVASPSFSEIASRRGVSRALEVKSAVAAQKLAVIGGAKPTYGLFSSSEAEMALKTGLARAMPDDNSALLPEIQDYRAYLAGRLKNSSENSISGLNATSDEAAQTSAESANDTSNAELQGRLSFKEAMENPDMNQFVVIPKSAFQAARQHQFVQWWRDHGEVTLKINRLRGEFIRTKITHLNATEEKISRSASLGETPEQLLAALSDKDLFLIEEAARGPQWLAYGYWDARLARQRLSSSPLKSLLDVFNDYHTMLRSIRPYDWAPESSPAVTGSDQEDLRNYYQAVRTQDGMEIVHLGAKSPSQDYNTPQAVQIEHEVDATLYQK